MACNLHTLRDFTDVCGNNSGGVKKVVILADSTIKKDFFTYTKDDPLGPAPSPSDTYYDAPYDLMFADEATGSTAPATFSAAAVQFYVNKFASSMQSTGTYNDNGANYVTTNVQLTFNGLRELYKFDSLRQAHPFVFVQMTDDTWYCTGVVGLWNRATASEINSGAQRTDAKNMSITYSEDSLYSPINVKPGSLLAGALNAL